MKGESSAIAIIPARARSTRFPYKILAPILNKPMIQYVWESARAAKLPQAVWVATDDVRIQEAVTAFGGTATMTPEDLPSGTDRVAMLAADWHGDIVVNVQGDEPLLPPEAIDALILALQNNPQSGMATLAVASSDTSQLQDPNVVKVVFNSEMNALYFSRAPIGASAEGGYYKHIGIYAYRKDVLMRLCRIAPSRLERAERLEQLRALENNIPITVVLVQQDTIAVDTPEDIFKVEQVLIEQRERNPIRAD